MSFDWADFLTLADNLCQAPNTPGPTEAALRSAISRAYYAAFCTALRLESEKGSYSKQGYGADHTGLPKYFQSSEDPARRQVGIELDRLRLSRVRADYDDALRGKPAALAESAVKTARRVLSALSALQAM